MRSDFTVVNRECANKTNCLTRAKWLGLRVTGMLLLAAALIVPARAATWNIYNGDVASLYAAANGAVSGDTVYIHGGATYYLTSSGGAVTPKNSGVSYTGDGDSTVIDGGWQPNATPNPIRPAHAGFSITTAGIHDITIENLRVQNCYQPGISIASYSPGPSPIDHITLSHCHTYMTHDSGIQVGGSQRHPDVSHPELYPVQHVLIDHCLVEQACYQGYNECISLMDGVSYSTINQCTVTNGAADTGSGGEGIDVKVSAQFIDVSNNDVHGLGKSAILIDANENSSGLQHIRIYGNKIYDNNGDSSGITVDSEWYNDGYAAGPLEDIQVYNNLVYNNDGAAGIYLNDYRGTAETHDNIWVVHNTIVNNKNSFPGIDNEDPPATNLYILNNIVQRTGHSGNWAINSNRGAVNNATAVAGNVVDDRGWQQLAQNKDGNFYSTDPGFDDVADADFSLNSPFGHGVDPSGYPLTGVDLTGIFTDVVGTPRPTGGRWDAGAYQYYAGPAVIPEHAALSGTLGTNGWYKGSVKVTINPSGADGAPELAAIFYTVDGGATRTYFSAANPGSGSGSFAITGDGAHTVTYWSIDTNGNEELPHQAFSVKIDSTPPTVVFAPSTPAPNAYGWYNGPVEVTYAGADATSGVAQTMPVSPSQVKSEGEGQTFDVAIIDNAGNVANIPSPPLNIDLTPPVTTASKAESPEGWSITLAGADSLSGIDATYYSLDGSQHVYSAPFMVSGAGGHSVSYWSVDKAGNIETPHILDGTISAAPVLTALKPDQIRSGTASLILIVIGSQFVANTVVMWNGSPLATTFISDGQLSAVVPAELIAMKGRSSVTVNTPSPGGGSSDALTFTITDASPPITKETAVDTRSHGRYKASTAISLSATDADGPQDIVGTYYILDGDAKQTYAGPIILTTSTSHTLEFWSEDKSGNIEVHHTLTVPADTSWPGDAATFTGVSRSHRWARDDAYTP